VGRGRPRNGPPARSGPRPSSEIEMHLEIYRQRQDVRAVVHTHPPTAIGVTAAGLDGIPFMFPDQVAIVGAVACLDYIVPCSPELAAAVAEASGDRPPRVLLRNHGLVTVGGTCGRPTTGPRSSRTRPGFSGSPRPSADPAPLEEEARQSRTEAESTAVAAPRGRAVVTLSAPRGLLASTSAPRGRVVALDRDGRSSRSGTGCSTTRGGGGPRTVGLHLVETVRLARGRRVGHRRATRLRRSRSASPHLSHGRPARRPARAGPSRADVRGRRSARGALCNGRQPPRGPRRRSAPPSACPRSSGSAGTARPSPADGVLVPRRRLPRGRLSGVWGVTDPTRP
jgi:hypothetical protein